MDNALALVVALLDADCRAEQRTALLVWFAFAWFINILPDNCLFRALPLIAP